MSEIGQTNEQIRGNHILYVESYSLSAVGPAALRLCDDHVVPQGSHAGDIV